MNDGMKRFLSRAVLVLFAIGTAASWLPAWIIFASAAWFFLAVNAFGLIWSIVEPEDFVDKVKPREYTVGEAITAVSIDAGIWLMLALTGHWVLSTVWFLNFVVAWMVRWRH